MNGSETREVPVRIPLGSVVLDGDLVRRVPKNTPFPLTTLVEDCLERGERVGVFNIQEDWIDVGRHQELRRARGEGDRA